MSCRGCKFAMVLHLAGKQPLLFCKKHGMPICAPKLGCEKYVGDMLRDLQVCKPM